MRSGILDVNGIKTNILTCGKWVDECKETKEPQEIILIIPGNPGMTGFYRMTMLLLHEKTGLPVWCISHAGHDLLQGKSKIKIPAFKGNESLYGLQGQIEHKRDFIQQYVPENVKLHIIGHSIGSHMTLDLLKDESINSKIVNCLLLFPTIEEMADTSYGKFMTRFIKPIVWLVVFLAWVFTILPGILQDFALYIYMTVTGTPKMHFKTINTLVEPSVIKKVFFMAFEELDQVRERHNQIIKDNIKKIRMLYGKTDGWAPASFCNRIKKDIPDIKAEICGFDHAFVLRQSKQVGELISDWILEK